MSVLRWTGVGMVVIGVCIGSSAVVFASDKDSAGVNSQATEINSKSMPRFDGKKALGGTNTYVGGVDKLAALKACATCHFLDRGAETKKNGLGPGLKGIVGRRVSITGVPYEVWDETSLNMWLTNPLAVKRGTQDTYKVISESKRLTIIEALKSL